MLLPDGVETVLKYWKSFKENKDIVGIVFQKGTQRKRPFDNNIQGEKICSIIEMTNQGMYGDHCEAIRASEFLIYPFPEFGGGNYLVKLDYGCQLVRMESMICG